MSARSYVYFHTSIKVLMMVQEKLMQSALWFPANLILQPTVFGSTPGCWQHISICYWSGRNGGNKEQKSHMTCRNRAVRGVNQTFLLPKPMACCMGECSHRTAKSKDAHLHRGTVLPLQLLKPPRFRRNELPNALTKHWSHLPLPEQSCKNWNQVREEPFSWTKGGGCSGGWVPYSSFCKATKGHCRGNTVGEGTCWKCFSCWSCLWKVRVIELLLHLVFWCLFEWCYENAGSTSGHVGSNPIHSSRRPRAKCLKGC